MKFNLRIFDNNHHWDEASSYDHGSYETYEDAVIEAKKIVEEFFKCECKQGITADDLMQVLQCMVKNLLFSPMSLKMAIDSLLVTMLKNM